MPKIYLHKMLVFACDVVCPSPRYFGDNNDIRTKGEVRFEHVCFLVFCLALG
jgi:hypothetical protein